MPIIRFEAMREQMKLANQPNGISLDMVVDAKLSMHCEHVLTCSGATCAEVW